MSEYQLKGTVMNPVTAILICAVLLIIGMAWTTGYGNDAVSIVAEKTGIAAARDKLGWMDDEPLTDGDRARIAQISSQGYGDNVSVIRSMQAGARSKIGRRDFELLRQDRRRARAAYPDASDDDLFTGNWLQVDFEARIPDCFCTSGNSNGTQGADGKWYLDGGCYVGIVRPQYPNRASAADTQAYFIEKKRKDDAARLERIKTEGPYVWWGGTGGSMTVRLNKETGKVEIIRAEEWSRTASKWSMPFVPEEWAAMRYEGDLDEIKKLPSFAQATCETIQVEPSGVSIGPATSTGRQFNGVLMPGESVTTTIQIR